MSNRKKSIYIVLRGRQPGVYSHWEGSEGAKIQVEGFANAVYKGFYTAEEAYNWLKSQPKALLSPSLQKWLAEQEKPLENPSSNAKPLKSLIEDHLRAGGTVIFTDGSTLGNPGPGGYAAVILHDQNRREINGGFRFTTNNRMELYACIAALESLQPPAQVLFITDSAYVYRAVTEGWLLSWAKNGWRRKDGQTIENPDLWQRLFDLMQVFSTEFLWIKGHNATAENEVCDRLAKLAAQTSGLPPDEGYQRQNTPLRPLLP